MFLIRNGIYLRRNLCNETCNEMFAFWVRYHENLGLMRSMLPAEEHKKVEICRQLGVALGRGQHYKGVEYG